jgi:hypothetical protein
VGVVAVLGDPLRQQLLPVRTPARLGVGRGELRVDGRARGAVDLGHPAPGGQGLARALLGGLDAAEHPPGLDVLRVAPGGPAQGLACVARASLGLGRARQLDLKLGLARRRVAALGLRQALLDLEGALVVAGGVEQRRQLAQRAHVARVARQHLLERRDRPPQEAARAEVRGQLAQHLGATLVAELGPQQQVLVDADRAPHLAAVAVEPPEHQVGVDLVGVELGRVGQHGLGPVEIVIEQGVECLADRAVGGLREARPLERALPPRHGTYPLRSFGAAASCDSAESPATRGRFRIWWISLSRPSAVLR